VTASASLWAGEQEKGESGLGAGESAQGRNEQDDYVKGERPWSFFYG
jgi:hypothetical protein